MWIKCIIVRVISSASTNETSKAQYVTVDLVTALMLCSKCLIHFVQGTLFILKYAKKKNYSCRLNFTQLLRQGCLRVFYVIWVQITSILDGFEAYGYFQHHWSLFPLIKQSKLLKIAPASQSIRASQPKSLTNLSYYIMMAIIL